MKHTLAILFSLLLLPTTAFSETIFLNSYNKISISATKCGKASGYGSTSITLYSNGTWDGYDNGEYIPNGGTYLGNNRKYSIFLSEQTFLTQIAPQISDLCYTDVEITSHSPATYIVKLNKNRTAGTVKSKITMRGYDIYTGFYGKAKYSFNGKATAQSTP